MDLSNLADRPGISPEELELLAYLMAEEGLGSGDSQAIRPRDPQIDPPLSFAQERLWFVDQWEPGNLAYNIPLAMRLTGSLDRAALEWSLNQVIRRHEALRTTFPLVEDRPIQLIAPSLTVALTPIDIEHLPAEERAAEALRLAIAEAHHRFDLQRGPLLRATLIRLSPTEHVFLLNMHHIIFDGWSMGLMIREITTIYAARTSAAPGAAPDVAALLPDLPIQYADVAVWQRDWLAPGAPGEVLEQQLSYWLEQLRGPLPVLQLRTDRPRPPVQTSRGAIERLLLPAELVAALNRLSQQEDASLFMTLLAAFNVLLARYSGQDDIIVGSPIANRDRFELESLMGFFVNTLLLRTDLTGNPSFRELLRRVRAVTLEAYAHQNVPFEQLVDVLRPERDPSYPPLFQVMFILQNAPMPSYNLPDLTLTPLEYDTGTAKFDLTLALWPPIAGIDSSTTNADELAGTLEYNSDLFDAATIRRMLRHFEELLKVLARDPDQPIADLRFVPEDERQLLTSWTPPQEPYADAVCLHELFARQAARTPDALAVTQFDPQRGERRLSYAELDRQSNQLAHYLRTLGVGPESRVGLLVERSPEMIVGLLGTLKAGGAYVPIDPTYPAERLAFILKDAQIGLVLTQRHLTPQLEEPMLNPPPRIVRLDADWPAISRESSAPPATEVQSTNLAYVIYTSGSTGQPKGVLTPHQAVVNYLEAVQTTYGLRADDRVLQFASLSFDASAEEIYASLTSGATLVLRTEQMLASAASFFAICRAWDLTALSLPTAYWHELCTQLDEQVPHPEGTRLRLVIIGGERALPERLAQWQQWAGSRLRLVNTYGPTEATIVATAWDAVSPAEQLRELPIGRTLRNVQGYILDQRLRLVPIGVPGELHLGGAGLARGYLNHPALTAERFVPDPFGGCPQGAPGARLYKTGDLARYLPDGNIEFLGRVDRQVKIRGFRIEPGEIAAVLQQHPAVREAVVLARQDAPHAGGHPDARLVAYVVEHQNNEARTENTTANDSGSSCSVRCSPQDLRHFLGARLPAYMVPSAFVPLDALPLTPSGKLDWRALPAPEGRSTVETEYVMPSTPLEQTLAEIWRQVLHLDRVGVHDNFFDLGGQSLRLIQVQNQIRTRLQREVPLPELFRRPTIRDLARHLGAESHSEAAAGSATAEPVIAPQPRTTDRFPLSFAQQRLWFLDQLEPDSASYNVPLALRLTGPLDTAALERCYQTIIQRHESLRTIFAVRTPDDDPVQVILPFEPQPLALIDLSVLPPAEREAEVRERTVAEASQPFDLSAGPLVRATLLRLAADEHLLLLTLHHIISDAWSMGVLMRELATLYTADDPATALPPLPIQYADFAVWQRDWLAGEIRERQLAYWKQQLGGRVPVLQLPTDRPRPAVQTFRGALEKQTLPPSLAAALNALSSDAGTTLFMTLLAAFDVLLYRYTHQTDLPVGSPIAGRRQTETEALIGFFVNTLVLRTHLRGDLPFRELLGRVRQVALEAYEHQDLPFELLVEELQPERDLSTSPLFQVMFVLQNAPLPALELPRLTLSPVEADNNTAKFDLTLNMYEERGELVGIFEYNTDLFDRATILRMADHWRTLLASIVADPDRRLDDLALIGADEREQMLIGWNATDVAYPRERCVHELFEAQAARTPDAIAAAFADRDGLVAQLSYDELNARANQLAHHLRSLGVGPDQSVGLFLPRSLDLMTAVLGVLKAGAAYLPLDPSYPADRLHFMLSDARAPVVLTHAALRERLPDVAARIVALDADRELIERLPRDGVRSAATSEHLAYIIYTSGSTGTPKGVAMPHRALSNLLSWQMRDTVIPGPARTLQFAPISFDASFQELFTAWSTGGAIVLLPEELRQDTVALLELMRDQAIERLFLPFVALQQIAEVATKLDLLPGSLREVMTAGEQLQTTPPIVELFERLPGCTLHNHYGPSETHVVTAYTLSGPPQSWAALPPIGHPVDNTQIYLLDGRLQPVPLGVVGELYLGGENLARGYLYRPALTAERFVPNPFGDTRGTRLYKTGDLARYLPDGTIQFLGRNDQQVKIRGYRIELGEIETVLAQHPQVQAVVVMAQTRTLPGETTPDTLLVAYVVPHAAQILDAEELITFLHGRLPEYMLPAACVLLEDLPRTPSGKIDRRALPAVDYARNAAASYVAPRTPEEQAMAALWAEVLGLEQVGIHDNFFALGGHSLLATRLMARLRAAEQIALPLRSLFETPTVAGLSQQIITLRRTLAQAQPVTSALADDEIEGEL
ncbi:MAG TPA: amino acid adenylation domain-containing protein [Herpetosiphonaceae bacterium]